MVRALPAKAISKRDPMTLLREAMAAFPYGTHTRGLAAQMGISNRQAHHLIATGVRKGVLVVLESHSGPKLGNRPRLIGLARNGA